MLSPNDFAFLSLNGVLDIANNVDPDEMPPYAFKGCQYTKY